MHVNKRVIVTQKPVSIINSPYASNMINIQKSKNTVLISNISIITFLDFAFYTRAASLEAVLHEAEAKTLEAEARFFGLEAEVRPRCLTSLQMHFGESPPDRTQPRHHHTNLRAIFHFK